MTPSTASKTAQDELVEVLLGESFVEDASPKDKTLAEHDKEKHPDGFNPETDTCKFRERIATETEEDRADITNPNSAPKKGLKDKDTSKKRLVSPEEDAAYMDAVKKGDMETAAKMVREVAGRAFPNTKVVDEDGLPQIVFHGSSSPIEITKFDTANEYHGGKTDFTGAWFTPTESIAQSFADNINSLGEHGRVYPVFLNIEKPFMFDAQYRPWDKLKLGESIREERIKATIKYPSPLSRKGENGATPHFFREEFPIGTSDEEIIKSFTEWLRNHYGENSDLIKRIGGYNSYEDYENQVIKMLKEGNDGKSYINTELTARYKSTQTTDELAREIRKKGESDGVIIENVKDGGGGLSEENDFETADPYYGYEDDFNKWGITDIIVFDGRNIKSAAPVTYDDHGNVIPLSRRFDDGDDIRGDVSAPKNDVSEKKEANPQKPMGISHIFTGSTANYDKPSLQGIGSGEGTQVYGWGLYGTTLRNDAEYYAAKAQANFVPGRGSDGRQRIYEQTFFTNRPEGDESHLLSWYEPVSDENKKRIDDALVAVSGNPMDWTGIMTGEDVYRRLATFASPQEASEFLAHNADIDGIKYPAEDHHGRTTGNGKGWNYVSFRDDNIRIDGKWVDGQKIYDYQEQMAEMHPNLDPFEVLGRLTRLDTEEEMTAELASIMEGDASMEKMDKTTQDELVAALLGENYVEDADTLKDQTLQEHDRQHHPHGYHEGDTCKFREELKTETEADRADEVDLGKGSASDTISSDFSDSELASLEELFGITEDLDAAGWLLPNGSLLDFNKDYHKEGQADWDEHGDLRKGFSDERLKALGLSKDGRQLDGLMKGIEGGLKAGAIRVGNGPDGLYLDLEKEPTPEQYEQLEQIAKHDWFQDPYAEGEGHVIDLGDGTILTYPNNKVLSKRLVADIKKHFASGDKETPDAVAVRMFHGDRFAKKSQSDNEGWTRPVRDALTAMAKKVKRFLPGVKVHVSPKPFSPNGDTDMRKAIKGREYRRWSAFIMKFHLGGMEIIKDKNGKNHDTTFDTHLVLEHTPVVLQRLGVPDRPIGVDGEILLKILGKIPTKGNTWHRTSVNQLRNIQLELDNPIAVFAHEHEPDKIVVLTRMIDLLSDEKTNDIIALTIDKKSQGHVPAHLITTTFGEYRDGVRRWRDKGLLKYISPMMKSTFAKWFKMPSEEYIKKYGVLTEKDFPNEKLGGLDLGATGYDADPNLRLFLDDEGVVVGTYNRKSNKVTLYPGADAHTIAHELCGHATWQYAEQQAARGDKTLLNKMNEVVDDEIAKPIWEEVAANYGGESHEVQREEVWAHIVGLKGSRATAKGKKWYQKAWGVIKDAWKGLLSAAGLNRIKTDGIEQMSPEEFADYMVEQMTSGKTLGKIEKSIEEGERKSIVGEKGGKRLWRQAKRLGIKKLDDAKAMEASGADRNTIWSQTGWWKGKDGKWRVEIPNPVFSGALVDDSERSKDNFVLGNVYTMKLSELIDGKPLFTAYPELADLTVKVAEHNLLNPVAKASYSPSTKEIQVYAPVGRALPSNMTGKSVVSIDPRYGDILLHELQHAIQDIEGTIVAYRDDHNAFSITNAVQNGDMNNPLVQDYINNQSEVESRNVQERYKRGITPYGESRYSSKAETPPWETEDVPEEQQIINEANDSQNTHSINEYHALMASKHPNVDSNELLARLAQLSSREEMEQEMKRIMEG